MEVALVILDGWGLADGDRQNAVKAAATPTFDRYWESGATGTLRTDGPTVGLPKGRMGNSEVGHLTIGAGRALDQPALRIDRQIEAGEFCDNDALDAVFEAAESRDGRVHLLGLVSDGGVHADQAHIHALIECAAERGLEAVTHAFMDGRDTDPTAGQAFIQDLTAVTNQVGTGDVATVSGRYFAMDRDTNWERTHRAYDAMVNREAAHRADSPLEAVQASYDRGDTDEFIEPTVIDGGPPLENGDSVVFCNFRADRARQLTRMLADIEPVWPEWTDPPDVALATMTEYDRTYDLPTVIEPNEPSTTLGSVLEAEDRTQLRIAESEKYPHVTYFINGGREVEFDGEIREIVASPDVPTYDEQPEMSAPAVTDVGIEIIENQDPDVMVLNYANPDMVGHTGDYEAAIEAVETVDTQLDRLGSAVQAAGGHQLVIADHGNAEDMGTPDHPHTAHTFNPAPFISLGPNGTNGAVRDSGTLADMTPTILSLMSIEKPATMTGRSLLLDTDQYS
jgi:2,3-bisphosphoglycerate-independent phosphoglycerate mutase